MVYPFVEQFFKEKISCRGKRQLLYIFPLIKYTLGEHVLFAWLRQSGRGIILLTVTFGLFHCQPVAFRTLVGQCVHRFLKSAAHCSH